MGTRIWAVFFVALALLASCTTVPNRAWWQPHDVSPIDQQHQSMRMVVEIDEKGPIFYDAQFQRLKKWLENESSNMPVVLFVNGWHHNAQVSDSNLNDFNGFIGKVEDVAGAPVVGVYIGWRGDSLDTLFGWEPSDFFTIWGRKKASVNVGEQGLRQILDYLREFPNRQVFVVGHSLGGSALFHAVKRDLASEVNDGFEYIMLNPAVAEREFREVEQEFLQAQSARLTRSNEDISTTAKLALERANRKITVMQALGDVPVRILYRIAFLNTPIGFDKKRITHRAYGCGDQDPCPTQQDPECTVVLADGKFIIETIRTEGGTCYENNLKPVWVISTADSVSASHGDILNSVQASALSDLLGVRIRIKMDALRP